MADQREPKPEVSKPAAEESTATGPADKRRRLYAKPVLRRYGPLIDLTLGGSPGSGDSGAGALIENPLV